MEFFNLYSVLLLILLITILVKINRYIKSSNINFQNLDNKINGLQKLLSEHKSASAASTIIPEKTAEVILPIVKEPIPSIIPIEETFIKEEIISEEDSEFSLMDEEFLAAEEEFYNTVQFTNDRISVEAPSEKIEEKRFIEPKKSWLQNFKEENPDIEKFIGENLINKIGILILVLGISFFVKYAIDKNWINEPARVGIGVLAGAIVLGVANRLKINYKAFSSVFVAGAFAIFYFTIAIAFQEYHLFSQTVAFVIMVVITIFSSFIAVSYNRQELGVMTLIAGFAVPFMVSTGDGNYLVLFTYVAILNIGMLIISYYKKWNIVNVLSFVFTCILYIGWWTNLTDPAKVPYQGAFIFATLFYVIFSIATVINNLRSSGTFSKIQYFLIIANTFFFFGIGMSIISEWGLPIKGLFTVALALYNLIFATFLYRRFGLNKNTVYLLVGLTLTFATLTVPIQFSGNHITIFWACEAVLLFWLAQKSKIDAFKWSAIIVQSLMLISLMMDWEHGYTYLQDTAEIIHPVFITGLVAIVSLIYTYYLLKKERAVSHFFALTFNPDLYRKILFVIVLLVGYFVGILETNYQAGLYYESYASVTSYAAAFHYLFTTILIYFAFKKGSPIMQKTMVVIGFANVLLYMIILGNLPIRSLDEVLGQRGTNLSTYFLHFILLGSVIYFIFLLVKNTLTKPVIESLKSKYVLWLLAFVAVFILSQEVIIQGLFFSGAATDSYDNISDTKTQIVKVGFPILWGLISFILLIIGIKKDWKQLRVIALSLLGLTIVKLFLYDINEASETGKIIAFILLGVLILIISFVYQKLKKLVLDESIKTNGEEVK